MNDTVILPRKLTAKNGAKALLIGEFYETVIESCYHCDGNGYWIDGFGDERQCGFCDGKGSFTRKISISWTTIKKIYDMIVKNIENKNG